MLDPTEINEEPKNKDLSDLGSEDVSKLVKQMLAHIAEQDSHIGEQRKQLDSTAQAIKWRDAKIEKITFELARLKAWRFGAKTERMNAEQREIFEETLAADQASLEAQLEALQAEAGPKPAPQQRPPKRKLSAKVNLEQTRPSHQIVPNSLRSRSFTGAC